MVIPAVIDFEATMTPRDWLMMRLAVIYRRPLVMWITGIGVWVTAAGLVGGAVFESPMPPLGVVVAIAIPALVAITNASRFRRSPYALGPVRLRVDRDTIEVSANGFAASVDWADCARVLDLPRWLVLFDRMGMVIVVPKSSLPSDDEVVFLLGMALTKKKLEHNKIVLRWALFMLWPILIVVLLLIWTYLAPHRHAATWPETGAAQAQDGYSARATHAASSA